MRLGRIRLVAAALVLFSLAAADAALAGTARERTIQAQIDATAARLARGKTGLAIASYTVAADGSVDPRDPAIEYNLDRRMPLGSSVKILVLGAYAEAVERGDLAPGEMVTVAEWERFYMPDTDGGSHAAALQSLGLESDEYGFALEPGAEVSLQQLAELMIRHSDNAAYDYFLRRLGRDALADLVARLGLTAQDVPISDIGENLLRSNHEIGSLDRRRIAEFATTSPERLHDQAEAWRERFLDPEWRAAEFAWRMAGGADEGYALQAAALRITDARGTAREFAGMMASIAQERFVSPAVSRRVAAALEWPMRTIPGAPDAFERWGEKGGSVPGVVTDNNFAVAKVGDFAGRLRITVVFVDGLTANGWQRLLGGELFQFEQRLMADASFVTALDARLRRTRG